MTLASPIHTYVSYVCFQKMLLFRGRIIYEMWEISPPKMMRLDGRNLTMVGEIYFYVLILDWRDWCHSIHHGTFDFTLYISCFHPVYQILWIGFDCILLCIVYCVLCCVVLYCIVLCVMCVVFSVWCGAVQYLCCCCVLLLCCVTWWYSVGCVL